MQRARALDLDELAFDLGEPLFDDAAIGFELGLAGPAEEAEAAALALEMGPGSHQPAFLIGQMRMLDLQRAFAGARAPAENFQNEAGAVEHLGVPGLFQIALLHRRERAVHHHDAGFEAFDETGDLLDLALAEIGRRMQRAKQHDAGLLDVEIDGAGEPDRLVELGLGRSLGAIARAAARRSTGSMTSARPVAERPSAEPLRLSRSERVSRRRGSNKL